MMELKCAFILISASLVLATPHGYGGYGVKGGASARAESSASSGAFGGIPVAVPLGAGYSGGFSKSSSSSSASSSASSSSSSSAFSYSGSGAGGFGLNDGAPGYGGCSSGNCQTAGDTGIPAHHGSSGSGSSGYNSANAAAAAGTEAISGSGCQGLSCASNSEKCTSGQCKPNLQTGTPSIDFNPNKCTSGQCGSALGSGASPTDKDSNDIRAVTASSDSAHNSDCSHGNCGPSGSSKLNNYGNSYQGANTLNNQQGSGADAGITSHYQKPSPHLESPKFDSKCNSGNCKAGSHEPGHETSPSSYNVPIHGTYDKGEPKPSCDGVKCEKQPKEPYSPTDNSITKGPSAFDYSTSTNCAGSSCFGKPGNQVTGGSSFTARPGNVNFGISPSHVPTLAGGLNLAPGYIGDNGKPSDKNKKLPNDKLPPYTGGFGGPAGILKPNEYDVRAPPANPSNIPNEKLPPYEGGFGGPSGTLKPNQFNIHASVTNKPTYAHPGSPSHNVQSPVGNIGTPACQAGGNCGGYSPTAGATSGASAPSGSYGTTKPNNSIHSSNDKQPTYTGGFGGPSGTISPNEHNSPGCKTGNCANYPSSSPSAGANAQTGSYGGIKPNAGVNPAAPVFPQYTSGFGGSSGTISPTGHNSPGCKTGNCANYPSSSPSAGANAQAGSYGGIKPNAGVNPAAPTLPQYTSGFGGPTGTISPTEHNSPGCKIGNCANYPSSSPSAGANAQAGSYGVIKPNTGVNPAAPALPQYTGGFGGPSGTISPTEHNSPGCKTGNCAIYPSSSPSASANAQAGSYGGIKPNTGVNSAAPALPQYTGGFGGPSGTISPTEHNSPGCKTGNCAIYPSSSPSAGANAQAGSYGGIKPNAGVNPAAPGLPQYTNGFGGPSGTISPTEHNSPGCKTGNCANYPSSSPSAGANAQAGSYGGIKPNTGVNSAAPALPQYTGGFGGPFGTISPTEHNSPGCKTGNCANYPSSSPSAGANAQAGSYGGIKPNAGVNPATSALPQYTSGFGGPSGTISPTEHNSPGCKTGNCANYPSSSPSAGANAQAGSYGGIKPNTGVNSATSALPQYTSGFGGPSGTISPTEHNSPGCKTGNCANYPSSSPSAGANAQAGSYDGIKPNTGVNSAAPVLPQYTSGFGGPSGTISPTEHNPPGCKTGNCGNYPTSGASAGASAQPGSYGVTKPNIVVNPVTPTQPQYTGGFGGPSGALKPSDHTYVTPSTGSAPTNCKTPNCVSSPTASADATSGANSQSGSYGITKPSAGNNPSNEKPIYSGGFGGAVGLLKPNEYTVPAVSPSPNNKPTGTSTPAVCTSGNCNLQTPHGSAPHSHNAVSSGTHATATATAEANAVAYTGGFGGPPGVLAPFDDGKIGALPSNGGQAHGSLIGGIHGSQSANIHSQHGKIPSANGGPTGLAAAHGITGTQAASNAGAAAYAGATAGASAGTHGLNNNYAGNIKGGSPCSGGCGGSSSGAYNGGSTYDFSGGHGFPKLVLSNGLNGAGSLSGATAKSLSGANAFGLGGSFASSSASAHASAGAYTKGGYGKR